MNASPEDGGRVLALPRRLGRLAAALAAAAGLALAAWLLPTRLPFALVAAAGCLAFAAATWRAFDVARRPPASFAWAGALAFTVGALAARGWVVVPLALAAATYLAAAVASSAWRFRTVRALT